jgi:type I restriction enzyme S subunit
MKDSGVQWLGMVPGHWEVLLLKRALKSIDYGISDSLESEGQVAVLRMGNIANGNVLLTDLKFTESVEPGLLLAAGDLLYNRTNSLDLIGKVGIYRGIFSGPITFASYLVRLRTVESCPPEFFAFLLNTDGILGFARANAFVAIGQCNLNPTRYGEIRITVPPMNEQIEIIRYLQNALKVLEDLSSQAQLAIELLQERRSALISAAVTGQIDVRDFGAN